MARSPLQLSRLCLLAFGLLAAAGCTSNTYNVKINAIANEAKESGESYRIVTKNGGDPQTDLRTREAVEYVKADALKCSVGTLTICKQT